MGGCFFCEYFCHHMINPIYTDIANRESPLPNERITAFLCSKDFSNTRHRIIYGMIPLDFIVPLKRPLVASSALQLKPRARSHSPRADLSIVTKAEFVYSFTTVNIACWKCLAVQQKRLRIHLSLMNYVQGTFHRFRDFHKRDYLDKLFMCLKR